MVQALQVSGEERRESLRKKCLSEDGLKSALGKCPTEDDECQAGSKIGHKLLDTEARDFLPGGKVCKSTGSKGVLLLESERDEYEKIYCKIDPAHDICEQEEEETESKEYSKTQATASKESSSSGITAGILSSSSSCCCLLIIIVGGMVMTKGR
jgi:hypothetical protein